MSRASERVGESAGNIDNNGDMAETFRDLATALGSATEVLVLLDLTGALKFVPEKQMSKLREDYERFIRRLGAFRQSLLKLAR